MVDVKDDGRVVGGGELLSRHTQTSGYRQPFYTRDPRTVRLPLPVNGFLEVVILEDGVHLVNDGLNQYRIEPGARLIVFGGWT